MPKSIIPKISVLMPVYNAEKYLTDSIESILNQTFTNFEFLIADDCSTDNSAKIIRKYAEKDNRIIFVQNEKNLNVAKTLNKLIPLSKSNIIARMDADCIANKRRLEVQYNYMQENNFDLLFTHANFIDDKDDLICKMYFPKLKSILKNLHKRNNLHHPTLMIKKEVYDKYGLYPEDVGNVEDWVLWKNIKDKVKFAMIEEILLQEKFTLNSTTMILHGNANNNYFYEAAKACLRNFDNSHLSRFYKKLNLKDKIIIFMLKEFKYYQLKNLLICNI